MDDDKAVENEVEVSFKSFDDLNIPGPLADSLHDMGFATPTPVQAAAIPPALLRRDILGIAATGTGKTAAFGIPLLSTLYYDPEPNALILAPTRELAAQIHKVLSVMSKKLKLSGTLLVGGESFRTQKEEILRGVDYIVATPGRLIDHLEQRTLKLERVGILVLDEVDRMLDMGFLPQVKRILQHVPEKRQTMIFSATLPREISNLANGYLKDPVRVTIGGPVAQPSETVAQENVETTQAGKIDLLLKHIDENEGRTLVFTRTKDRAERLAKVLERKKIFAALLHGGRSQGQRKKALEDFRRGTCRVMVATDLAGRGIDIDDIEHVINYDMPQSREDYIHRIGRTGRQGKSGKALTFVTPEDIGDSSIFTGGKAPSRVVFRSHRRRR